MPQKRIPTPSQDAGNWGTILNDHLAQTQNPLNGAFNSFDQFSARPTNLTADDSGKTYLYTQTGNWHEWSGTEWKVQNKSEINVKDYGAIGDGVTDDTAAIQRAIDLYNQTKSGRGILKLPDGTYKTGELFFRYADGFAPNNDLWSIVQGSGNTTFVPSFNSSDKYLLNFTGTLGPTSVGTDRCHNVKLVGFKIEGGDQKCSGISLKRFFGLHIENVSVNRCNIGIYMTAVSECLTVKIGGVLNNTHIIADGSINSNIGLDNDLSSMSWIRWVLGFSTWSNSFFTK